MPLDRSTDRHSQTDRPINRKLQTVSQTDLRTETFKQTGLQTDTAMQTDKESNIQIHRQSVLDTLTMASVSPKSYITLYEEKVTEKSINR